MALAASTHAGDAGEAVGKRNGDRLGREFQREEKTVKCFVLVRNLEEMSLHTCETNGRNDMRASESGFVFRSCSYANVGFFWGMKFDADDANLQTDMRTRLLGTEHKGRESFGLVEPDAGTS